MICLSDDGDKPHAESMAHSIVGYYFYQGTQQVSHLMIRVTHIFG